MNFKYIQPYIFSITHLCVFLLSLVTNWYLPLVVVLIVALVVESLEKLGRGIVLREMIALFGVFITLAMPLLGYSVYNHDSKLARIWVRYMPVPENFYFDFALPAVAGFVLVLCWPMNSKDVSDTGKPLMDTLDRVKVQLERMPKTGIFIVVLGLIVFALIEFLPVAFQFFASLLYFASFAGILYVYFTPNLKFKKPILILFTIFIISNALRGGMFTIVAYMGITMFSFLFLGKKAKFWKKLAVFAFSAFLLLVIQSVKVTYRRMTWRENYQGNQALLFSQLVWDRLNSPKGFLAEDAFFPIYYRTNQGYNVAMVMRRFPNYKQHDYGENLAVTLASSVVPRILWPSKPEAGGKFNMLYYTGLNLRGWSTNVGPLGEAYGSFGVTGGILYMIALGAFIRWCYRKIFVVSMKIPLVIFWLPVLFYQITYSAESDSLQIFNSIFKSAFFVWLLYKITPEWFGFRKKDFIEIKKYTIVPKEEEPAIS